MISISAGVALLGIKFGAYFVTGSTTIFADALEGVVNVTTSVFAFYALTLAHRPADDDHPYGHGKVEFFSAGFEGGMILLAGAVATAKAGDMLLRRQSLHMDQLGFGLILMVIALRYARDEIGWLSRSAGDPDRVRRDAVLVAYPELAVQGWRGFALNREIDALATRLQGALLT